MLAQVLGRDAAAGTDGPAKPTGGPEEKGGKK